MGKNKAALGVEWVVVNVNRNMLSKQEGGGGKDDGDEMRKVCAECNDGCGRAGSLSSLMWT